MPHQTEATCVARSATDATAARTVAIFHNHPRFLAMAMERLRGGNQDIRFATFDLGRFARGMGGSRLAGFPDSTAPGEFLRIPLSEIERADAVLIGIDPQADLPPIWRFMLGSWIENRARRRARLILLEDDLPEADATIPCFLAVAAALAEMDFIRDGGASHPRTSPLCAGEGRLPAPLKTKTGPAAAGWAAGLHPQLPSRGRARRRERCAENAALGI